MWHPKCDTFFVSKGSLTRHMNTYKENPTCGKSKKILSKKDISTFGLQSFRHRIIFLLLIVYYLWLLNCCQRFRPCKKMLWQTFFATQNALNQHEEKNRENETCTRSKKYYDTPVRLEKMEGNIFPGKTA